METENSLCLWLHFRASRQYFFRSWIFQNLDFSLACNIRFCRSLTEKNILGLQHAIRRREKNAVQKEQLPNFSKGHVPCLSTETSLELSGRVWPSADMSRLRSSFPHYSHNGWTELDFFFLIRLSIWMRPLSVKRRFSSLRCISCRDSSLHVGCWENLSAIRMNKGRERMWEINYAVPEREKSFRVPWISRWESTRRESSSYRSCWTHR